MIYESTLADVLDQRIADLGHDAKFYKAQPNPRHWRDLRIEADRELRWALRLRRTAKALAGTRPDPIEEAQRYGYWTQGELATAFGR